MVMEASPSPQSVGREFVRQYYTLLNKAPAHLHRFYNNYSSFVHGGLDAPNRETLPVVGQKQIHNRIQQLNFRDCHAKISQVDAQATLGSGVVVQVTGELSNGGAPMRRFTQTFVLAAQSPKKYYVHNDIFRYQDIVFSDESGSASGRSEGEEEETGGYFPPPPPPPAAPLHPQHNGHPPHAPHAPHLEDEARHLVAALQASSISVSSERVERPERVERSEVAERVERPERVERAEVPVRTPSPAAPEPEPEPERSPEPPARALTHPLPPAAAPLPPEPKTYANLLKSGATRGSPPAAPAAPAAPGAPAAAPEPREHRPRTARLGKDSAITAEAPPPPLGAASPPPRAAAAPPPPGAGRARYPDAQQLFLGNLPHAASEEALRALFAQFGPVQELRVHSKPAPPGAPRHPNYGFITYCSSASAAQCLAAAPLYFPPDSPDAVKLNVEEKKTRSAPRRRPLSATRPHPHRAPHRR